MKESEQERASMEARILAEAEKMFLEVGYAMTSTSEIARRVGCNQSMVHYYFRTKELLFLKVFSEKKRLFALGLTQVINGGEIDIRERIKSIIEAHFAILAKDPGLPFLVFGEILTNAKRRAEIIEDFRPTILTVVADLQRGLDAGAEQGAIAKTDAMELLFNIVSLNVTTFLAKPLLCETMNMSSEMWSAYLAQRKADIVKFILNSLTIKS